MKRAAPTRDRIIEAACSGLASAGLDALTVGRVAALSGVSSALVHYHFATKEKLLHVAARRVAHARTAARAAAFEVRGGLATLDAVWRAVETGVASGAERSWHDLVLRARSDVVVGAEVAAQRAEESRSLSWRLPSLLVELGSAPPGPVDELVTVVIAFLDGAALALASGERPDAIKSAFDALWLALIGAGQTELRR